MMSFLTTGPMPAASGTLSVFAAPPRVRWPEHRTSAFWGWFATWHQPSTATSVRPAAGCCHEARPSFVVA